MKWLASFYKICFDHNLPILPPVLALFSGFAWSYGHSSEISIYCIEPYRYGQTLYQIPAGIALYQVQATARTFTSEKIRFDYNKNTYYYYYAIHQKLPFASPKKRKKNTTFYSSFLKPVCMITLLMLNIIKRCDFHLSLYYSLLQSWPKKVLR